jgi:hypothetical protein
MAPGMVPAGGGDLGDLRNDKKHTASGPLPGIGDASSGSAITRGR